MIWLFNPWNITKSDKSCNTLIHLLFIPYLQVFSIKNQRRQWQPTPVLLPGKSHGWRSLVGYSPWGRKELDMTEQLHFHFHSLEKEMATHSSVLAWRIPGTGEPGGLPSMGWHRVGHEWSNLAAAAAAAPDSPLCLVGRNFVSWCGSLKQMQIFPSLFILFVFVLFLI